MTTRSQHRCLACRALIGPGHASDRSYEGLCEGCVTQRDSGPIGAALVAGAIEENKQWGT